MIPIFGDLPKGLSPFLSAQLKFLSDTNNKNDILTIIGIGVVVILVVVVSVFSNMSRVAFDTTEREEKKSVETTVIQSVSTLEQSIVGIAERVDSLDAHFMEETTMLKKMIKPTVDAKHGERKKK